MSTYLSLTLNLSLALMVATLAGTVTFIALYRPYRPSWHGPAGRHLLYMSYCLSALYGVSLLSRVFTLPLWLGMALTVLILGGLCAVVWQRVWLLRREQRAHLRDRLNRD